MIKNFLNIVSTIVSCLGEIFLTGKVLPGLRVDWVVLQFSNIEETRWVYAPWESNAVRWYRLDLLLLAFVVTLDFSAAGKAL